MKRRLIPLALFLAACGQNVFLPPLTLTATPAALTLAAGDSARVSVTASSPGAPTAIPVTVDSDASGLLRVTGEADGATLSAPPGTPPGSYSARLHARGRGAQGDTTVQVTVTAATSTGGTSAGGTSSATPDFTVTLTPQNPSVQAGGSVHLAVTVTPQGGFAGKTTLSVSASGMIDVTPDPQGGGFTATATKNAAPGSYLLTATVQGGGLTRAASVTLNVTQGGGQP